MLAEKERLCWGKWPSNLNKIEIFLIYHRCALTCNIIRYFQEGFASILIFFFLTARLRCSLNCLKRNLSKVIPQHDLKNEVAESSNLVLGLGYWFLFQFYGLFWETINGLYLVIFFPVFRNFLGIVSSIQLVSISFVTNSPKVIAFVWNRNLISRMGFRSRTWPLMAITSFSQNYFWEVCVVCEDSRCFRYQPLIPSNIIIRRSFIPE